MRDAVEYKLVFKIVREVIAEWDPYGLLSSEAPKDEFDAEVAKLMTRIPEMKSGEDTALVISEVFSRAFEPELFSKSSCIDVGNQLFKRLCDARIIK